MTDPRSIAQPDPARTVDLGTGWRAAVAIDDTGEESLWLVSPTRGPVGCACRTCAPHEQVQTDRRAPA